MLQQRFQRAWTHFESKWHSSHLSNRGSYSIERLHAFDDYSRHTPLHRVWAICILLPLPAFLMSLVVEIIPVQNPLDGWKANHGIWTRFFVGNAIISTGFLIQIKKMVPKLILTPYQIVFIAVFTAVLADGIFIGLAKWWAFPVPFGLVLICPFYITILVVVFIVVVERGQFHNNTTLSLQFADQVKILVVQASLFVVYPAYGAIYNALPPTAQGIFLIMLPILKAVMGNVVAYASRNVIENMPGIALLSVEVFNALYSVKCMQNGVSIMGFVAILTWNGFESVMAYRGIRSQIAELNELRKHLQASGAKYTLPQIAMELCLEPGVLGSKCSSVRLRSSVKFKLTDTHKTNLAKMESLMEKPSGPSQKLENALEMKVSPLQDPHTTISSKEAPSIAPLEHPDATTAQKVIPFESQMEQHSPIETLDASMEKEESASLDATIFPSTSVPSSETPIKNVSSKVSFCSEPTECDQAQNDEGTTKDGKTEFESNVQRSILSATEIFPAESVQSIEEKRRMMEQTLAILFQCEFHVLVKYVEYIIPLMYAIYMVLLFQLPSVKYYPDTAHMTLYQLEVIILKVCVYVFLEVVSFVTLHYAIKWKFGFSPAYILAFVLEHQFLEFQGRLVVWYLYVLELTLYHFGVDFSLQFAWLHPT